MIRASLSCCATLGLTVPAFTLETVVQSAQYAPFGPLTQLHFGNGSQWTRTLDQNYAIDAITSAALSLDATLDDAGTLPATALPRIQLCAFSV